VIASTVTGRHRRYGALIQPPPGDNEKYLYLFRSLPYLTVGLTILFPAAFTSQVLFEYNSGLWVFGIFTTVGTLAYMMSTPLAFIGRGFDIDRHIRLVQSWQPRHYPDVDIFMPICGEPLSVLGNSWAAVAELVRAYPGWAFRYVLDDGDDPAAEALAAQLGFGYVVRPNPGEHKKSGNLRYAFANTQSEFFAIFDADFAPRADFLAETRPHFNDESVAIVQTPQFFPHRPPADVGRERGGRHPGTVLPGDPGGQGPLERRYLRGYMRRLPQDGARAPGRHDVDSVRRGRAYGTGRPQGRVETDLSADRARDRHVPDRPQRFPPPAVPVVHRIHQHDGHQQAVDRAMTRRARMTYVSGFCYHVFTAVSVFVVPLIPITLLIFRPWSITPLNSGLVVVSMLVGTRPGDLGLHAGHNHVLGTTGAGVSSVYKF
jgi:cellulose synthase (UDP-forming)